METAIRIDRRGSWHLVQTLVWIVGAAIWLALWLWPPVGIHAFWNVLIPVAPALMVFGPGLWRNICPLASTALLPRHLGRSRRRTVPVQWQGRLNLAGITALLLIVPLRHVVLDLNGPATALTIALLAIPAVFMGTFFEWKSGWCSGACPVHPVEKLYGSRPSLTVSNAHCHPCEACVSPCPDSTPGLSTLLAGRGRSQRFGGTLMVGGFVGFIWGWFQVPDYAGSEGWSHLGTAYGLPFAGLLATSIVFLLIRGLLPKSSHATLVRSFVAAAVSCYYWYRLPALFGFGQIPGDGMLVDLRGVLPLWFPAVSRAATTLLFAWWFLRSTNPWKRWAIRPIRARSVRRTEPARRVPSHAMSQRSDAEHALVGGPAANRER